MNQRSATPNSSLTGKPVPSRESFPKSRRLLRPSEFRQVYEHGQKVPCACFVAFCWKAQESGGPKVGFTAPKVLGKATVRNRMKRRVRETLRKQLWRIDAHWRIVVNLRRAALAAPQLQIENDVERVLSRCSP